VLSLDTLAMALNSLKSAEMRGHSKAEIKPASKEIKEVLLILQKQKFVGDFEFVDDGKSGSFAVTLAGKINNAGVVKPRFSVKVDEWEKFEERYLPARELGMIIASTPQGIMTHQDAKKKGIGGRLLCYIY